MKNHFKCCRICVEPVICVLPRHDIFFIFFAQKTCSGATLNLTPALDYKLKQQCQNQQRVFLLLLPTPEQNRETAKYFDK